MTSGLSFCHSLFTTLNNDGFLNEPFTYYLQKNIIYNGQVDVLNGLFSFEFIVPKDISYEYGRPYMLGDGYVAYFHNILDGTVFIPWHKMNLELSISDTYPHVIFQVSVE